MFLLVVAGAFRSCSPLHVFDLLNSQPEAVQRIMRPPYAFATGMNYRINVIVESYR